MSFVFACRKLCLILKPDLQIGSTSGSLSIRLIPTISADTFSLAKLAPDRNCLRLATAATSKGTAAASKGTATASKGTVAATEGKSTAKGQKRKRTDTDEVVRSQTNASPAIGADAVNATNAVRLPTPQYNTSIVADMMIHQHQQVLQTAVDAVPKLRDAIVLLKVRAILCFAVEIIPVENIAVCVNTPETWRTSMLLNMLPSQTQFLYALFAAAGARQK